MNIYVDADACPVIDIIIDEAKLFQVPVILVKSFAHHTSKYDGPGVKTVYVDSGLDSADYRIMQLASKEDIIITQDYGLASLALGKGCTVLHHKGFLYTLENIDNLLMTRHMNAKARKGGMRMKGPKPLTNENRLAFQQLLHHILVQP